MAWIVGIGIFIFLLCVFPRQIGSIVLLIALAAGAFWAYFEAQTKTKTQELKKIAISASANADTCSPEFPIHISIHNGTNKTIDLLSFTLNAQRPGYSSRIYSKSQSSDKIIQPSTSYSTCWSLGSYDLQYGEIKNYSPQNLSWSAALNYATYVK